MELGNNFKIIHIYEHRAVAHGRDVYEPKDGAVPHGCGVYEPKDG